MVDPPGPDVATIKDGWELYRSCSSWDEADIFRTAINRDTSRFAQIRFENAQYLVEWRKVR